MIGVFAFSAVEGSARKEKENEEGRWSYGNSFWFTFVLLTTIGKKDVKHFEPVRGESRLQDYCKLRLVKMTLRIYNYGHSVLKDYFFPPSYCSDVVSKSTCFNLLCFFIVFFFSEELNDRLWYGRLLKQKFLIGVT